MVPLTELDEGLGFFALEDSEIQATYATTIKFQCQKITRNPHF